MAGCKIDRVPLDDMYRWLLTRIHDEEALRQNNFPRADKTVPGKAVLCNLPHKYLPTIPGPNLRKCVFCSIIYSLDEDGNQPISRPCSFHPLKRPPPNKLYSCCGAQRFNSQPCKSRNFHVTSDVDDKNLVNYLHTVNCNNKKRAIYSLDCEFVHTKVGHVLAAIALVDHNGEVVLNSFVRPDDPILDYLPQYSNLTAENYSPSSSKCLSMAEYREKMREILGPDVIIIGHSVHQDLMRMEVIHDKVLDTSLIFPHHDNPSCIVSLATLKKKYIGDVKFPDGTVKALSDSRLTLKIVQLLYQNKIRP